MKLRRNKKGFTIIELVIVIAVIGILAAVLIPTFVNLTNKANEAADNALVNNLNKALKMEEQEPGHQKAPTLEGAIKDLEDQGYILENLASKSGKDLLWSQSENQFLLNTEGKSGKDYWKIVDAVPAQDDQKYSYYAGKNFNQTDVSVKYGFDAGRIDNIGKVTYVGTGTAQEVAIRTNGESLTVNAPTDTVMHFGEGRVLKVEAVGGASYHEYGYFPKATVKQGRIVAEKDGQIQVLDVSAATGTVVVEKASTGDIHNVIKGENPNVTVAEDLTENISTVTTVTTWAGLKSEVENGEGANVIYVGENLTGANQAINIGRNLSIIGNGHSITGSVARVNNKIYKQTSYYGIFNIGNPNATISGLEVFVDSLDVTNNTTSTCYNMLNSAPNAKLTISNSHLKANQYAICTEVLSSGHKLSLKNIDFDPLCYNALNWFSSNGNIEAEKCNFVSTNTSSGVSNSFCTICINAPATVDADKSIWNYCENNVITLNNSKIVATGLGACRQALIDVRSPYNNVLNLNNSDWTAIGNSVGSVFISTEKWEDDLGYVDLSENKTYYPVAGSKEVTTSSKAFINGNDAMDMLNIVSQKYFRNPDAGWAMYCYTHGLTNWDPNTALVNESYDPFNYQYINNGDGTWRIVETNN